MKLHTLTGTQFGAFSGGQIQRIAIARALIRKPRILIMDEATSALDNHLQEQIMKNLIGMNCTIIFIAHRLKIAKGADEILVMDSGEIVERGTHEDCSPMRNTMQKCGRHFYEILLEKSFLVHMLFLFSCLLKAQNFSFRGGF